jgi:hypothetical protein
MRNTFATTQSRLIEFLLAGIVGLGCISLSHAANTGADVGVGAKTGASRSIDGSLSTGTQASPDATTGVERTDEQGASNSTAIDADAKAKTKTKKKKGHKEHKQGTETPEQ